MIDEIIFVVGYTAGGKSYVSKDKSFEKYFLISSDDIIRNYLMENPVDTDHFKIYIDKNNDDSKQKSYDKFIEIIRKLIKNKKKVVIEGQLTNNMIIYFIQFAKKHFIIFVMPKNKKIWHQHIISRFINDPANYGKIGALQHFDNLDNNNGLNDYIKNGINGKIIQKLFKKTANEKYKKHAEKLSYYKSVFDNIIIYKST